MRTRTDIRDKFRELALAENKLLERLANRYGTMSMAEYRLTMAELRETNGRQGVLKGVLAVYDLVTTSPSEDAAIDSMVEAILAGGNIADSYPVSLQRRIDAERIVPASFGQILLWLMTLGRCGRLYRIRVDSLLEHIPPSHLNCRCYWKPPTPRDT